MLRHPLGRLASGVMLAGLLGLLGACTGEEKRDLTDRDASIYQIVIADLVNVSGLAPGGGADEEAPPVVFIDSLGAVPIPLETQVELVGRFVETYELRFIDDIGEAVQIDVDGQPVRTDGLLLGLGPIKIEATAEVRGELYLSNDDIRAFRYTLVSDPNHAWTLASPPAQAEPEGFANPP
jgi:hypothetical protein